MKLPLLALLCVGTAAFCQSPGPGVDPDKLFQIPEKYRQQAPNFAKLGPQPFRWSQSLILARPPITPRPKLNDPQIDPKIILHPPWPSKRDQPKGQDVSRLYPNLKLLPIR